jgi:chromosomal replication initiator protein
LIQARKNSVQIIDCRTLQSLLFQGQAIPGTPRVAAIFLSFANRPLALFGKKALHWTNDRAVCQFFASAQRRNDMTLQIFLICVPRRRPDLVPKKMRSQTVDNLGCGVKLPVLVNAMTRPHGKHTGPPQVFLPLGGAWRAATGLGALSRSFMVHTALLHCSPRRSFLHCCEIGHPKKQPPFPKDAASLCGHRTLYRHPVSCMTHEHSWQQCCAQLATVIPDQQFAAWIKPLSAPVWSEDGSTAILNVPNRFKLDWLRSQYAARITESLSTIMGRPVQVDFVVQKVPARAAMHHSNGQGVHSAHDGAQTTRTGQADDKTGNASGQQSASQLQAVKESVEADALERSRLNPMLSFETLVTGKANQLARAAAIQVAENPGRSYNPLFIYGGVGLGKTHLMHAVGNALLAQQPGARIRYLQAEQFVSEVVRAYQRKAFEEFKRYYHSLDLLLIDDVQFFAGKDKTQEEFFYAFEALITKRSQIILTSDTYPKELREMDQRLVSRFDSGLTVAIEPPELEMRVAILLRKADAELMNLPEEVAFFVAKNVRSNVRELEGALRKILAYARFSGQDVSISLAKEALKDLLSLQNRQVSVENIQKTVADFYKIKVADMYSKKRPASIARPRQIAMYLAKELTHKSLPEIGELFGGRDHTTVLHAVRKIGLERTKLQELNQQLHVLEQTLKA